MDLIFEILLDLIIEGCIETSSNKKVPKVIRYPLIVLIVSFFLSVIFGLAFIGIFLWSKNIYASSFIILVSLILLTAAIYRLKKIYMKRENKDGIE